MKASRRISPKRKAYNISSEKDRIPQINMDFSNNKEKDIIQTEKNQPLLQNQQDSKYELYSNNLSFNNTNNMTSNNNIMTQTNRGELHNRSENMEYSMKNFTTVLISQNRQDTAMFMENNSTDQCSPIHNNRSRINPMSPSISRGDQSERKAKSLRRVQHNNGSQDCDSLRNVNDRFMHKSFQPSKMSKFPFWKFMSIITKVVKFINITLNMVNAKKQYENLTDLQLEVIQDLTYYKQQERENNQFINEPKTWQQFIDNIVTKFMMCLSCIPIIQPNHKLKIVADCYQSVIVIYRMFITTIKLSFFLFDQRGALQLSDKNVIIIINISFIFDMFISFNTGYYEKGIIIEQRVKIIKNYLRKTFISDIFAQIPLFVNYFVDENSTDTLVTLSYALEFLIFMKWFSLKNVFTRLERVITENESIAAWFPLVGLVVNLLIVAHIVGICWNLCAQIEIHLFQFSDTWLHTQPIGSDPYLNSGWIRTYIASFYWAVCTMVTILLYIPETDIEIIFSILAMFVCAGCFGYGLNTIGNILNDINRKNSQFKAERVRINRFIKKNNITAKLKERIQLYIDYLHEQEREKDYEEENQVLNRFSEHLRRDVKLEMHEDIMNQLQIITENFSEDIVRECMLDLQLETFSPGAIIIQQDDLQRSEQEDFPLYYVQKGQVQLSFQRNKKIIPFRTIQAGQIFGVQEFFTGQESAITYSCKESCSIYKLRRNNFLNIIMNSDKNNYEMFMMMKNDMMMIRNQNYKDSFNLIKCNICNDKFHVSDKCPTVQMIPSIKKVIYDYNYLGTQLRIKYDRSFKYNFNALNEFYEIKEIIDEIFDYENSADPELFEAAIQWREFYETLNFEDDQDNGDPTSQNDLNRKSNKKRRQLNKEKRLTHKFDKQTKGLNLSLVNENITSGSSKDNSSDYLSQSDIVKRKNSPNRSKLSSKKSNKSYSSNSNSSSSKKQAGVYSFRNKYLGDKKDFILSNNEEDSDESSSYEIQESRSIQAQNVQQQESSDDDFNIEFAQSCDLEENEDKEDKKSIKKSPKVTKKESPKSNINLSNIDNSFVDSIRQNIKIQKENSVQSSFSKTKSNKDISFVQNSDSLTPLKKINKEKSMLKINTGSVYKSNSKSPQPVPARSPVKHFTTNNIIQGSINQAKKFKKQTSIQHGISEQQQNIQSKAQQLRELSVINKNDPIHISTSEIQSPYKKPSEKRKQQQQQQQQQLKQTQEHQYLVKHSLNDTSNQTKGQENSVNRSRKKSQQSHLEFLEESKKMRQSKQDTLVRGLNKKDSFVGVDSPKVVSQKGQNIIQNMTRKKSQLFMFSDQQMNQFQQIAQSNNMMENNNNINIINRSSQPSGTGLGTQSISQSIQKSQGFNAMAMSRIPKMHLAQQNDIMNMSRVINPIQKKKIKLFEGIGNKNRNEPNTPINLRGMDDIYTSRNKSQKEGQDSGDQNFDNWYEWDLLNFDKIKEYMKFYFHNNVSQVLDDIPKPKKLKTKKSRKPNKKQSKLQMSIYRSKEIIGEKSKMFINRSKFSMKKSQVNNQSSTSNYNNRSSQNELI